MQAPACGKPPPAKHRTKFDMAVEFHQNMTFHCLGHAADHVSSSRTQFDNAVDMCNNHSRGKPLTTEPATQYDIDVGMHPDMKFQCWGHAAGNENTEHNSIRLWHAPRYVVPLPGACRRPCYAEQNSTRQPPQVFCNCLPGARRRLRNSEQNSKAGTHQGQKSHCLGHAANHLTARRTQFDWAVGMCLTITANRLDITAGADRRPQNARHNSTCLWTCVKLRNFSTGGTPQATVASIQPRPGHVKSGSHTPSHTTHTHTHTRTFSRNDDALGHPRRAE